MAGCKPEYLPVVLAAVEGIADPAWSYHGPGTSTGGAAVLMIVNGPIARELDINAGRQSLRPGLARQRHHRAGAAAGHAQRLRVDARPARPRHARPSGQALVRDRRERGGEPLDAVARRARLPPRAEHGHRGRRGGPAPVLQPALQHRRGGPDHAGRRHAHLRQRHGAVALTAWSWPASTCAPSPPGRLDQGADPALSLRAHQELATRTSSAPGGWRAPSSRATRRRCGRSSPSPERRPRRGRRRAGGRLLLLHSRAGAVPATQKPSPRRSSDDRAARSHRRSRRRRRWPTRPGRTPCRASASPSSRTRSSTRTRCS